MYICKHSQFIYNSFTDERIQQWGTKYRTFSNLRWKLLKRPERWIHVHLFVVWTVKILKCIYQTLGCLQMTRLALVCFVKNPVYIRMAMHPLRNILLEASHLFENSWIERWNKTYYASFVTVKKGLTTSW